MEYSPGQDTPQQEDQSPPAQVIVYPPKYEKREQPANIWLRSIISLALYLVLGYYIFHSFRMLLLITAIILFHELGHFFAMKYYRYNDLGIFFIPLLGAYVSGTKREVSQKESAVILLAGPLPGIILGVIFYLLYIKNPELTLAGIPYDDIALSLVILNLINLLPIYPLDGGQLLNRVYLDEESWMSKLFVLVSIGFLTWFALFGMSRPFPPLLIFPVMMLLRMFGDSKLTHVEKKIETQGINLDRSYSDLPDADYWKIRNMLVENHPGFKDVPPAPPFEYSPREEKVMSTIQSLLHRHLIQDVSLVGKIFIFLVWLTAFVAPWLLNMHESMIDRLRF